MRLEGAAARRPGPVRIVLVLPARRLWRWHAALVAELAKHGELVVRLGPSAPYPLALRSWLALERTVFGRRDAAPIRAETLGVAASPMDGKAAAACDLLVDLSNAAPSGAFRRLALRFDGQADEAALFAALQARRSPRLEVVESDGRIIAVSQPAVEVRKELGRSLGYIHARLLALVLRAVEGGVSPACPPAPAAPAEGASLGRFVGHSLCAKAAARLSRHSGQETWGIALRRAPVSPGDAPPDRRGFAVDAGPADAFHADPFLFAQGAETFLFVEAYPWATRRGVIACARLDPQGRPGTFETVLQAGHHLSYPQVFAHDGDIYMLPETAAARRLEYYRATDFPSVWRRAAVALEGLRIADSTLLEHEGRWWLFASLAEYGGASQDELFAWHGPSPLGPWTAHTQNPLVSDVRAGRPAGRFVRRGGRLYRPAQDSEAGYGAGLAWCEVLELTPQRYREQVVARWRGEDFGPYTGVHTFSEAGGFEAVDLKSPRRRTA